MTFDVIVGNPPYQDPDNERLPLWQLVFNKVIKSVKKDGYLCFVHPSNWRKPEHKLLKIFQSYNLLYLEIHNSQDGQKVFGAGTRYDWYVLQKSNYLGNTTVVDEKGEVFDIDVSKMNFIPHFAFNTILSLIAKNGEETCEIIQSYSSYETRKKWMNPKENNVFKYPCIHSIHAAYPGEEPIKWYSKNNNKGMFGKVKLIAGLAGCWNCLVDYNGEYGITHNCFGIKDTPENCEKIFQAFHSDKFKELVNAIIWSGFAVDWRVFKFFKKDFWKYFLE